MANDRSHSQLFSPSFPTRYLPSVIIPHSFVAGRPTNLGYAIFLVTWVPIVCSVYLILFALGVVDRFPSEEGLVHWDAVFYKSIVYNGYQYADGALANAAFFPFFAYVWKVSGLGGFGISVLNGCVFLVSLYGACVLLKPRLPLLALFLSLPALCFLYLPLSEAWFFAFGVLLLYGIVRQRYWMVFVALLMAGLTRPTCWFLIPALVGMELMTRPKKETSHWRVWWKVLSWYILPLGIALLGFALLQYVAVGEPFAYYKTQSATWGRAFGFPVFPLGNNLRNDVELLRGVKLWVGMLAAAFGLAWLYDWLLRDRLPRGVRPIDLLAVIYLCMCLVSILFFNPEWNWIGAGGYGATVLTGINRYTQPNPFLLVFLIWIFERPAIDLRYLAVIFLATHLLWFALDLKYYDHIQRYLRVSSVTLILLPYWACYFFRVQWLFYTVALLAVAWQSRMLWLFMTGVQVD